MMRRTTIVTMMANHPKVTKMKKSMMKRMKKRIRMRIR
jgi:hypothetical protein